ncbi:MAG TPA: MFS transporter [Stellaceae bacterium]|jgi:AAHS family 4-hydroxybenzoate transporter-like MFS transporter|nr:MFS transporter [Stellaceae bacterium]
MQDQASIHVEDILDHPNARPFQIRLMLLLALFMFFEGYDMQVLSFAAPVIIKEWHSNKAAFGGVFGGAMAGFMFGAMVVGNFGDYVGRARMIIGGSIVFGVFTILSAYAGDLAQLLYWRVIAGIGLGCAVPNAIVLLSEYWPARARATSVTLIYVGYTVGSAIGGVIAAYLIPHYGWPSVFILGGIAPLVVVALLAVTLPESLKFLIIRAKRPQAVVKILNRVRPDLRFDSMPNLILGEEPKKGIPVGELFMDGRAMATCMLWLAGVCSTITLHFLTSWLPVVIESEGVPLGHAIITTSVLQISGALGGIVAGRILDRYGLMALAGFVGIAIPCLFLMAHIGGVEVLTMSFVGGCGLSIIGGFTIVLALGGLIYPAEMRSSGSGWTYGVARLGAIMGPTLGGVLLSYGLSAKTLFQLAMVPIAVEVLAFMVLSLQPSAMAWREAKKTNESRAVGRRVTA